MMEFHFGDVIGMDYLPELRLMTVAPTSFRARISAPAHEMNDWWAIVVRDTVAEGWLAGTRITVSPLNAGITMIACRHQETE